MRTTPNKLIFIGRPIPFDTDVFLRKLEGLMRAAYDGREDIIRDLVADVVTTFRPAVEQCYSGTPQNDENDDAEEPYPNESASEKLSAVAAR